MSIINPLHPASILISLRRALAYVYDIYAILPPSSSVTVKIAPQPGLVWVLLLIKQGKQKDAATHNPLETPLLNTITYQVMQRSPISRNFLDSNSNEYLPCFQEISDEEPFSVTYQNHSTTTAIEFDAELAIMEIGRQNMADYRKLWQGLYNFLWMLGDLGEKPPKDLLANFLLLGSVVPKGQLLRAEAP